MTIEHRFLNASTRVRTSAAFVRRARYALAFAVLGVLVPVYGRAQTTSASAMTRTSVQPGVPTSLTLADAVRIATGTSENVALARAGTQRARGQQIQARSALLPQLNTSLSYQKTLQNQFSALSKQSSSNNTGGGNGVGDSTLANNPLTRIFASPYTTTFSINGSQALYTGGQATANIRAANASRESAEIGITSSQAQAVLDVTQAYYDALLADELVTIAESSLVQSERTFRQVQLTRTVGSASEFELLRARVTRDNQRPDWLQSRTNRSLAYVRLRQLLDFPVDQPLVLTDRPEITPFAPRTADNAPVTTVNVVAADVLAIDPAVAARTNEAVAATDTSIGARAPVRQAEKSVEIARQGLRAQRGARLPTVSLTSNYQRLAYPADGIPRSLSEFYPNWTAGLTVSFPLFTGFRLRGQTLAAEATLAEAEQRLKLTQEGAAFDARTAVATLEQAEAAWQASVGTEEQATRAYTIAEVRFREGISAQIELSDSRVQQQQAAANRARAARDLSIAKVRVQLLPNLPLSSGQGSAATAGSNAGAPGSQGSQGTGGGTGAGAAGSTRSGGATSATSSTGTPE